MAESATESPSLAPARLVPLTVTLAVGVSLRFVPPPEGVRLEAWHLLAIFVAIIVGMVAKALPMDGVSAINILMWVGVGSVCWNIIGLM